MSAHATAADVLEGRARHALHHGDCLPWLDSLPDACLDAIVSDLPYAEIDRDYGRMTEAEWEVFAHALVRKSLRVLKPRGSAVFIVQPNSEHVGRMRAWVFRFLAWCSDDLVRETGGRIGMVQDAWWFNPAAMPTVHCNRDRGLMRPSMKPCVWVGPDDCFRAQEEVLMTPSSSLAALSRAERVLKTSPSGHHVNHARLADAMIERGGQRR